MSSSFGKFRSTFGEAIPHPPRGHALPVRRGGPTEHAPVRPAPRDANGRAKDDGCDRATPEEWAVYEAQRAAAKARHRAEEEARLARERQGGVDLGLAVMLEAAAPVMPSEPVPLEVDDVAPPSGVVSADDAAARFKLLEIDD